MRAGISRAMMRWKMVEDILTLGIGQISDLNRLKLQVGVNHGLHG